ncbi:MAG: hypothetical protein OES47_06975 [Acidobacteriota bacterium]|nr:hypothetical protein [Acidobacteriota bacterium]
MMFPGLRLLVCALLLPIVVGCGQAPAPVASLAVNPSEIELPGSGFTTASLSWQMNQPLVGKQGALRVFVHLMNSEGEVLRTFDHDFFGEWQVGQERTYDVELFQSALGPALENGVYELTAGLYDESGNRWPLETAGERIAEGEYRVATVQATDAGSGFPEFYFSESWMPVEGGTDRQILGRRWLSGDGALRLARIRQPGTIWLRVGIPSEGGQDQELVLQPGQSVPAAEISSECLESPILVEGVGGWTVKIEIGEGEDGGLVEECEIRFATNFELLSVDSRERRTIALETLAWAGS